jgi:flagellar biosynthesis/type III secretory pathway protein FliH
VALGGEQVAAIVLSALDRQRRARSVRVRVRPSDADALAALEPSPLPPGATIVPDPSLAPGDCIVESELGTIDARVATKLEALRRALESVR